MPWRLDWHHLYFHPQLRSQHLQQIGHHPVQGVIDVEKTQRRNPAVDGHPDFFLLTQPGPLLAGQLDLAGPDREAAAIPAFGNFLPLAFQNFIQRNIDDFFKPLIFPFQRKRKTMGVYIKPSFRT
nr:hypothetical protein [Aeromonas hydrophila]